MAGAMGSELDRLYSSTLGGNLHAFSNRTTAKEATQKEIVAEYVSGYEQTILCNICQEGSTNLLQSLNM